MVIEAIKMLKVDAKYDSEILFVTLEGKLTTKNSYKINNYLLPLLEKYQIKTLVYNLHNLKMIDEKGKDALLNSKYKIKKNQGKVLFYKVNKELAQGLKNIKIPKLNTKKEIWAYLGA